ncbi:sugar phosphate isomerase/epimerase and 4-hydroxyphenylpyruvate domain-containing protein [Tropicibacter sp. R16_0]|uniref:bifunctional sugar phosphate isomerase/epimerase/4-hydroxyphenylpyruvate dioxygenase family protein n=1 Tax=Tropicibacter sp. R16_0 TaxID=2821102 RepID=UPI001ADCCE8F|nr:sugar phosphate isomerase/epimerase and 4-hydroxyphenylpyruvate domain-containing protein [Tropicibacter sp. R16_0]MBO9452207.1 sugar phosphate isomerase/epimerase and 4-hydroxyphenylpyruvate domain-containing protein [Tropicibacter sp. R16_0]
MKTSIATVSISGNLREKLEAIAAAGFDGIEIFEADFIADYGSPRDVGRLVRDHGLEIMLFQPFRDFETLPEPARSKAFDRAEHKFDVMQELGTDLVLVCSSVHPASLGGIERAADDFHELGDRAAKRGLRVGYEALAWGRHINDHRDAWEVVRRADHPNIGLIVDSFHTLGRKLDPDSIRSVPGDKIFFVQLADAPLIEMDLLYWSRHFRNMPGEGDLDVTRFMQAVMATGYDGPISLEIFNDQFRGGNPRTIAKDGHRSLVALMGDVRRAEPELSINMPEIPVRVEAQGFSFVEFATRSAEATALKTDLASLGFEQVGQHRNKAAGLWQQGDIRIVVNEETTGHAASSWNARGTCVCALGLLASDAKAAATRASALGAEVFAQPVSSGELAIPAVRGLSGSVLHFLDDSADLSQVWQMEFSAGITPTGAGLTHIDHVAQTMSYEDMLSWSLFYTTLFDMTKAPMVDVIDPDGLVRSQAVEAASGSVRITLNGADSHRTLAGSFLSDSFGASVQHIAFATSDIFETLEHLARKGFETLPISPNYYDDLTARFDLNDALIHKMQARGVLYDQTGGAEFFQAYSQSFGGGLFIEIVQRSQGYTGYGAPNAPFRIAAQKRLSRAKGIPRT